MQIIIYNVPSLYMYISITQNIIVGNPNPKKMHIFGFVGIFEYIC